MDTDPPPGSAGWIELAYLKLAPVLVRRARRLLRGNAELAADFTHETFAKLLQTQAPTVSNAEKAKSGPHLVSWLNRVQTQLLVNHHRRNRYRQPPGEDRCMEEIPDSRREAHDQMVLGEELNLFRRFIDALPEPQREVMRLRSLGLKTSGEIGFGFLRGDSQRLCGLRSHGFRSPRKGELCRSAMNRLSRLLP
jgi:RNA polymerase sigma factor (sigma-70 family)